MDLRWDDAGQFDLILILHALCWIHTERTINKLVGFNDQQREALEQIRTRIWDYYDDLKAYKEAPTNKRKTELQALFDDLFTTKTCFATLNAALLRLNKNKSDLLLVLDYPEVLLHNNLSERDIREYVKKRKVSGSTRRERGRRCRDTFASRAWFEVGPDEVGLANAPAAIQRQKLSLRGAEHNIEGGALLCASHPPAGQIPPWINVICGGIAICKRDSATYRKLYLAESRSVSWRPARQGVIPKVGLLDLDEARAA